MHGNSSTTAVPRARVLSLDVLRGITIAFMILVNDPGDGYHTYAQLEHSVWNGCTLTDLVFPTFLLLVGVSTIFSLRSRLARGASRASLALHIIRRSVALFAIDLFIAAFPYFHLSQLRLYGVLTRIALCYLCVGLICLVTQRASRLLYICIGLLFVYWVLLRLVPVPGFGIPTRDIPLLDPDRNLTAWLDRGITFFLQRTIHTGVLYEHTRDPEGLLSTLPAIATTLIGSLAGIWIQRADAKEDGITRSQCARGLFFSGLVSGASGVLWNLWFPINKKLWTSSYVLFAAGWALVGLGLCCWFIEIRGFSSTRFGRWFIRPWLIFGSNAIVAYAFSELMVEVLTTIRVHDGEKMITAWAWVYFNIFARSGSTAFTSLLAGIAYVAFCFLPNWLLWRKRIFVRV